MAIFCEYYWEGFYVGKVSTYCQEMGCIFYFTTFSLVRSVSEPYKTSPFPQKMENKINILRLSIFRKKKHSLSSKLTSEKPILLLRVKNVPLKQMLPEVAKLIRLSVKDVTFIVLTKIPESCIFCDYFPFWDNYWIWVKMQQFCENSVWQKPRPGLRLFAGLVSLPLPRHYHPADC